MNPKCGSEDSQNLPAAIWLDLDPSSQAAFYYPGTCTLSTSWHLCTLCISLDLCTRIEYILRSVYIVYYIIRSVFIVYILTSVYIVYIIRSVYKHWVHPKICVHPEICVRALSTSWDRARLVLDVVWSVYRSEQMCTLYVIRVHRQIILPSTWLSSSHHKDMRTTGWKHQASVHFSEQEASH